MTEKERLIELLKGIVIPRAETYSAEEIRVVTHWMPLPEPQKEVE